MSEEELDLEAVKSEELVIEAAAKAKERGDTNGITPLPGVISLLEKLRSMNFEKWGIVTSGELLPLGIPQSLALLTCVLSDNSDLEVCRFSFVARRNRKRTFHRFWRRHSSRKTLTRTLPCWIERYTIPSLEPCLDIAAS